MCLLIRLQVVMLCAYLSFTIGKDRSSIFWEVGVKMQKRREEESSGANKDIL